MPTTVCPECNEDVFVDAESEQGDVISCDECGSALTVVGLDPIEVDLSTDNDPESHSSSAGADVDGFGYEDEAY